MRLLVACPKCGRQYDASQQAVGSRFRCRCGEAVAVHQPEGHDAAVVRCSSCGAPREGEALSCEFCGAAFTLHERDLDTVCPHCMARVSDRAKFCHCCGTALAPEPVAGLRTALACPACRSEQRLQSRRIGEINVMECDRCAGLWLSAEAFARLADLAGSEALRREIELGPTHVRAATVDSDASGGPRYRNCPVCNNFMNRNNYGSRSGVIIDTCKEHGAWFDADELARILAWIREGGLAKANHERALEAREEMARLEGQTSAQLLSDRNIGQHFPWVPYSLAPLISRLFC